MKFDASFHPSRSNLSPAIAAAMDRAFFARRPAGLNVQFLTEAGALDEWSFASAAQRDRFTDGLRADGRDFAVSV